MSAKSFRNLLEIDLVPVDCTIAEVEARIVVATTAAGSISFDKIHMDVISYNNFKDSVNINESKDDTISATATAMFSASLGRVIIINAFKDLVLLYNN